MKSARINFGIPDSEYILEVDDTGAATSLVNQDTNTEYVGGGGSSDFSTAQVTLIRGSEAEYILYIPAIDTENNYLTALYAFGGSSTEIITVPLYKGTASVDVGGDYTVNVSGDAVFDEDEYIITITSDCTITIS